jgi:hypothetical protein
MKTIGFVVLSLAISMLSVHQTAPKPEPQLPVPSCGPHMPGCPR